MKKYKCIIFDLDGTVLDTERMNFVPLQRLVKEELGLEVEYEKLLKYKPYAGRNTLKDLGFKDIEKSYSKWVKYVNEFEEEAILYDGFEEVFKTLNKNNILCGIVSSKTRDQYEIDFVSKGLDVYIKEKVLAEDTELHKPHPEPILKFTEMVDINPKDCMYIGDTIFDFKATKAAGMDFAIALWGADNLEGIEADFNLNEPLDILRVLNFL